MSVNRALYRMLRRQGDSPKLAFWKASPPKYPDVSATTYHDDEVDVVVNGTTYFVRYEWDDMPYDWGDMEPTEDDIRNVSGIIVMVRDDMGRENAVCGVDYDERENHPMRYAWDVACELIDEMEWSRQHLGRLLLPAA